MRGVVCRIYRDDPEGTDLAEYVCMSPRHPADMAPGAARLAAAEEGPECGCGVPMQVIARGTLHQTLRLASVEAFDWAPPPADERGKRGGTYRYVWSDR